MLGISGQTAEWLIKSHVVGVLDGKSLLGHVPSSRINCPLDKGGYGDINKFCKVSQQRPSWVKKNVKSRNKQTMILKHWVLGGLYRAIDNSSRNWNKAGMPTGQNLHHFRRASTKITPTGEMKYKTQSGSELEWPTTTNNVTSSLGKLYFILSSALQMDNPEF